MSEPAGLQSLSWEPLDDWQQRAQDIATRLRQGRDDVRFAGAAGDYVHGDVYDASVLRLVLFRHDSQPRYERGALEAIDGVPVIVDWASDEFLFDRDRVFADDVIAHRLMTMRPLLTLDQIVRDSLASLRDDYFGALRQQRLERLLDAALARLDAFEASGAPGEAALAFLYGFGPALCHLVDEPPSTLRLLRRFAGAARVRRMPEAVTAVRDGFGLDREAAALLTKAETIVELSIGGSADAPARARWRGEIARARRAVEAYRAEGDQPAAAWAALGLAASLERELGPELRGVSGYPDAAEALYGRPAVQPLRHVVYEIKALNR